jgi:hypothetical protein
MVKIKGILNPENTDPLGKIATRRDVENEREYQTSEDYAGLPHQLSCPNDSMLTKLGFLAPT